MREGKPDCSDHAPILSQADSYGMLQNLIIVCATSVEEMHENFLNLSFFLAGYNKMLKIKIWNLRDRTLLRTVKNFSSVKTRV
jgi:hypothetical protein